MKNIPSDGHKEINNKVAVLLTLFLHMLYVVGPDVYLYLNPSLSGSSYTQQSQGIRQWKIIWWIPIFNKITPYLDLNY